jgi:hypothetical protein
MYEMKIDKIGNLPIPLSGIYAHGEAESLLGNDLISSEQSLPLGITTVSINGEPGTAFVWDTGFRTNERRNLIKEYRVFRQMCSSREERSELRRSIMERIKRTPDIHKGLVVLNDDIREMEYARECFEARAFHI